MDPIEMLDTVTRSAGLDAGYHVTTFNGYRPTDGGGAALTTVEVWDRGPGAGASRFTVLARDELGRSATGDPRATLDQAMTAVRWATSTRSRTSGSESATSAARAATGAGVDPSSGDLAGGRCRAEIEGDAMYALVAIGLALTVVMLLIFGPLAGAAAGH